jgi:hypothetical protein
MLSYKPKRKTSFLGDVLILVFLLGIIYLIYTGITYNKISEIKFINYKYGLYPENLVSENYMDYISELGELKLKKYTPQIINYNLLYKDSINLKYQINSEIKNGCISNKLLTKIRIYNNSKKELSNEFKAIYPYQKDLYWSQYISALDNTESNKLEIKLKKLPICN